VVSLAQLCRVLEIKSPATLNGWLQKEWDRKSVKKRLNKRGRKRTLTSEQEAELLDWIIGSNDKGQAVSGQEILDFCKDNFDWLPKLPWVSKFTKRNRVRSHLTQKRPAKRDRESSQTEIADFRAVIDAETTRCQKGKKRISRVWTVDEFGVWDDEIRKRGYSPIGTTAQRVSIFFPALITTYRVLGGS